MVNTNGVRRGTRYLFSRAYKKNGILSILILIQIECDH